MPKLLIPSICLMLLSSCAFIETQHPNCIIPLHCQKISYVPITPASIEEAQILIDNLPDSIYIVGLRSQPADTSLSPHGDSSGFPLKKHVVLADIVGTVYTDMASIPQLVTIPLVPLPLENIPENTTEHQNPQNSLDTFINDMIQAYEDIDSVNILGLRVYGPRGDLKRFLKDYPNWEMMWGGGGL